MPRRWLPLAFALALVLPACAEPPNSSITFGSGNAFVPQVADAQDDVGLFPSLAVNDQGVPYVAYFGFPEQLAKGEVAIPRPVGSPSVPAVLLASVQQGIWTRGAVAMEKAIPNVNVAYGPAEVPAVKSMERENVNGTSIALDANGGLHVAWVADTGVWYAHNMDGTSFDAAQVETAQIKERGPIGEPSIAVDQQGTPWIAYSRTTAKGQDVVVATQSGATWSNDVVATVPLRAGGPQPGRTAIATTSGGSPIVLFSTGSAVEAATRDARGWSTSNVETGVDGAGVSLAAEQDGTLHAAYYADGEIHAATSKDGTSWQTGSVASVGSGENDEGRSTGIATGADGTTYVTWYDPGADEVRLASGDGSNFSSLPTTGTTGGELPTLAVAADGSVYIAWYDTTEQNLMLGVYGSVGGMAFAVQSPTPTAAVAVPSGSPTGAPTECSAAQNGELTVTAEGIQFDTSCIQIPAGQKVMLHFDNKDSGTQHNIAVYKSKDDLTTPLFRGDPVTGPDTADYEVGPLKDGEYYFQCDFHPTTMTGTFKVVSGGGGGGKGAGGAKAGGAANVTTSVTASGLQFDTDEIDLQAGKPTTLTFNNQDAETSHNIAIYPSEADASSPDNALFQGDLVTGPASAKYDIPALKAGTYYFHCDVHPTMSGSVVVS